MLQTSRIERLLDEEDVDLLIASTMENVYYTSGMYSIATAGLREEAFSIWSASLGGPYLVMPAREMSSLFDGDVEPAGVYPYGSTNIYESDSLSETDQEILAYQNARDFDDPLGALTVAIDELADGPRIAIETEGFTPDSFARVERALGEYEIEPAKPHLYELRRIKSETEIRHLRRAAEITEAAMEAAMATLEPGTTERELANEFRVSVCEKGGEPIPGFLTVGFGERTAYTHPLPGDREIQDGDIVRWDGGCTYEQYCSDIGRTYAFRSADAESKRKYEGLYAGMEATLSKLDDGALTGDAFRAGVEAVQSSDVPAFENFQPFHLGHGIGVEIYDPPTIVPDAGRVHEGMVMCVEPPYNELGRCGFLIEDEVLITNDGYEKFTSVSETLPIVG